MVYTLKQLRDMALRHADEVGSTTSATLFNDYLNNAHQRRCLQHPWHWMLSEPQTFTTVVGRQLYPLSHTCLRPLYFFNLTSNFFLHELPNRRLNNGRWDFNNTTGTAQHFMRWERTQVQNQPTAASVVTIVSNNALDTGVTYNVAVKGLDANGNEAADVITPNGTTPVTGVVSFVTLNAITKAAAFNGNLTATTNSGAVTSVVLLPWEMGRSYPQIFLVENPGASETIQYRFYKHPTYLINDYDQPDIPDAFAQILVWDALVAFATYNADVGSGEISVWQERAAELERALYANDMEANTLNSLVPQVHNQGDWDNDFFLF